MKPPEVEIETRCGPVRGTREEGSGDERVVLRFRGIPYAQPPVGALRFRPPQPPAPWRDVLDARSYCAAPPQSADPLSEELGLATALEQDEDCLTLNVATPALDQARRPVLVWIHGGAFQTGTGAAPIYDPERLVRRGDVVVVTLNYRIGALGFLFLGGKCANLGLLDQVAALRWVRDEIERFGGDPERVCVFGQSAGAGSIAALLAMPAARGLFARAIIQSGAVDSPLSADEGTQRAVHYAAKLGAEPVAEALRAVPVSALLDAQLACSADGPHRTGMFFGPVLDGEVLPETPISACARGACREVELIIGTALEEMRLYLLTPGFDAIPEALVPAILAPRLAGDETKRAKAAQALIHALTLELSKQGREASPAALVLAAETELSLRIPSIRLGEAHARHQPCTWMYLFTQSSPMHDGRLGAFHALDLFFTFGALEGESVERVAGPVAATRHVSEQLMDAWLAFARSGDPSHVELGTWPRYEVSRRSTLELGDPCRIVDAPLDSLRALIEEIAPRSGT